MAGSGFYAVANAYPLVNVAFSDTSNNITLCSCLTTNIPTGAGFAIGCELIATDTGYHYVNTGTATVASFVQLGAGGGGFAIPAVGSDSTTTSGNSFALTPSALTTGNGLIITGNALTSGFLADLVHTVASNIISGGSMLNINSAGVDSATTTGALLNLVGSASTAGTQVLQTYAALTTGIAESIVANALTTGKGVSITSSGTGMTSGSLLYITSGSTGAVATNGIVSIQATGNYTSTSNVGALTLLADSTTAGTVMKVSGNAITTGMGLLVSSTSTGITTGSLLEVTTGTTGLVATNGIVYLVATGAYTSTSNIGLLNVVADSTITGTVARISAAAVTSGTGLLITGSALQTTGNLLKITNATAATATTGLANFTGAGLTTGILFQLVAGYAVLTTGRYLSANDGTQEVFGIGANGHIHSVVSAAPPTIATNATGISACAITAGGTDTCGIITTTGTPASGTVLTITFGKTYTTAPKFAIVNPVNAAAGNPNTIPYISTTATTAVITWPAGGVYAATPSYSYLIVA